MTKEQTIPHGLFIDWNQSINVNPGSIFENRTFYYLTPALKLYGEEFMVNLRACAGLATGIQDYGLNRTREEREYKNEIYMLFDIKGPKQFNIYANEKESKINFSFVLHWIREQPYYVNDYPYDSGRSGHQHMIVLKLPIENLMQNFINGQYTKMYTAEQIQKCFTREKHSDIIGILTKEHQFMPRYTNILNSIYGTHLNSNEVIHHDQYDIPPFGKNEIFRWVES